MERQEINALMEQHHYPDSGTSPSLQETHISWIIIGAEHAFKIKKPLALSFLDFSTLSTRQHYCQQELTLNQRLEPDLYLDVLPIKRSGNQLSIGPSYDGEIIDYAVYMKKLEADLHMPAVLEREEVTNNHIRQIARKIAYFHQRVKTIESDFSLKQTQQNFNDLRHQQKVLERLEGAKAARLIPESIEVVHSFLEENEPHFQHRHQRGMVKDCHGDLHSGNIFLYDPPVIFDCIEFNKEFRQIDVLNEIAFFCMDMEAYKKEKFSRIFQQTYFEQWSVIQNEIEKQIFLFYKCYRANVRLKVNLIQYQEEEAPDTAQWRSTIAPYLQLLEQYTEQLREK